MCWGELWESGRIVIRRRNLLVCVLFLPIAFSSLHYCVLRQLSCTYFLSLAKVCEVNLGFVLDASGTTRMPFDQEKFVLLEVAREFNLQPLGTQAAVARCVTKMCSVTMAWFDCSFFLPLTLLPT